MTEAPPGAGATRSLRARAVRGSAWVIFGFGARMGIRLGGNLVMTRLLFPQAFGLMALVQVFVAGLEMFSDVGLRPSIVQSRRGDDPAFLRTAWTIQVARGALLWLLATAVAGPLADYYEQPELAQLIPVGALVTLIAGLQSTSLPRLNRHLSLARPASIQLASQITTVSVMVVWATFERSVWALVFGTLAGRLATTLLSHLVAGDHRDGFGWDRDCFRELLHFGGWIFVSTVLVFFANQADRLIFGKTIPLGLLGVYSVALVFASVPNQLIGQLQTSVVFPAFSRALEASGTRDRARLFRRVRLPVLVFAGLGLTCLAASGPWLIETLYDPRYAEAGWILQLLALGTWFHALAGPGGSLLLALGRPRWLALANASKIAGIAALVPLGFAVGDFPGAVLGFASAELLRYAAVVVGARRVGIATVSQDLLVSLLAALAALAGLLAARSLEAAGQASAVSLLAAVATTSLLWALSSQLMARREGESLLAALRPAS